MQVNRFGSALCGQFDHRQDMFFMAVDATRGHQAHDVYRFACLHGLVDGAGQRCVGEEVTVFDLFIQTGQVLIHDAAGAEVHVTDFRVTHLAIRQADIQTGSGNQGMGLLFATDGP
ncbi:Uncharacterised protein [Serratia fonticola]|uniref:Uncharacterized protein n=1 Tax=Serratia fonticola TaxID=47917 RepID=A0A4U9TG39_SERFO|nr:Uncharacterised protein [Serratia fonticola]